MITSKENFIKLFTKQLELDAALAALEAIGVNMEESLFIDSFYEAFDMALSFLLDEDGQNAFYENILFRGVSVEDAVIDLNIHFT